MVQLQNVKPYELLRQQARANSVMEERKFGGELPEICEPFQNETSSPKISKIDNRLHSGSTLDIAGLKVKPKLVPSGVSDFQNSV